MPRAADPGRRSAALSCGLGGDRRERPAVGRNHWRNRRCQLPPAHITELARPPRPNPPTGRGGTCSTTARRPGYALARRIEPPFATRMAEASALSERTEALALGLTEPPRVVPAHHSPR